MGRLGDHLSDGQALKYVRACLTPGRVLLLPCTFMNPPKAKFLVFVGCDTDGKPLFLVIIGLPWGRSDGSESGA